MASVALLHGNPGGSRPVEDTLRLSGTFYPLRPHGQQVVGAFIADDERLNGLPIPVAIPVAQMPETGWAYPEPVPQLSGVFGKMFKFKPLKMNLKLGGLSRLQPLKPLGAIGRGLERVTRQTFDATLGLLNVGLGAVGAVAQVLPGARPAAAGGAQQGNVPQGEQVGPGFAPPAGPLTETLPPSDGGQYVDPFGADPYADPSYYSEAV